MESTATVAEFYNANLVAPNTVVVTTAKDWNAIVDPGRSISLGFRAVGTPGTDPAWFTVDDLQCDRAGFVSAVGKRPAGQAPSDRG
ncbi:cellulose binding domain-containing protein [Actinoplanes sp. CA-252034]|uniref:cellulose binding domain-containing protein n=1 Tax=Actinoplanes sp. CA-252034 TaxID=3239906 RepID=UPI003D966067